MPGPDLARAEQIVATTLREVDALITLNTPEGRARVRELDTMLREADSRLGAKLWRLGARLGDPTGRFTGAQARVYQQQVQLALRYVQARLRGLTAASARGAIQASVRGTVQVLGALEAAFTGIVAPLALTPAMAMVRTQHVRASLARQHATSMDRYGRAMLGEFERMIRVGLAGGLTQDEMVASLVGRGGPRGAVSIAATVQRGRVVRIVEEEIPEGLFVRHRYWAERIVRTETARAWNDAALGTLYVAQGEMPDVRKKILAHFDSRTADDSVAVHGQVRRLDEVFTDGAGRTYLMPPARPNDRETTIPWRPHWPEVPSTRVPPPGTQQAAIERAQGARDQAVAQEHAMAARLRLAAVQKLERQRTREARIAERALAGVGQGLRALRP